ncbi:sugar-binding domain-containing protein, partial [Gemmiger sp.]|uniref:sugar-binding domain-containing protein n=1 Tax=Gemmiger sp. TaxID=2049027 RepID=UPI003A90693E
MSKAILLNTGWTFTKEGHDEPVTLPHTWNAVDGQDGGNDYYRGTCTYTRTLEKPELSDGGRAVLQFDGVAMTAVVSLNGEQVAEHKGGYSTFRVDITDALHDGANELMVSVDNSDNDTVYPQKADFTFYGGIYRDVTLHVVPAAHFALAENVTFTLDGQQTSAAVKDGTAKAVFTLEHAHLWDGLDDPYLYTMTARLDNGETATTRFGCRKFEIDPQKGFILNGREYPLRGVSRHQD